MGRTTRNLCLSPTLAHKLYQDIVLCRTWEGFSLSDPFWYLGKAFCYGWGRQFSIYSLTLAQIVSGHYVLPDVGSFSHLWAFVLFGQGIFHGESSNPFIARGGRLSFYSPCAEGTSICWLSKFERQFHLIIPNGSTRLSCSSAKPICGITKYSPSFKINFDLVSN